MTNEFKQTLKFPEQNEQQQRPSITIPLKSAGESLFLGTPGSNPGPMTMVSNIFNNHFADGDFRSFAELLSGSPAPTSAGLTLGPENWDTDHLERDGGSGFKQKRPGNLVLPVQASPVINVSPVFSPSVFFTSPTYLSPTVMHSPFGTTQEPTFFPLAALSTSIQSEYHSTCAPSFAPHNQPTSMPYQNSAPRQPQLDPPAEKRLPNFPINVDKPQDDGYNWRKYGQKQVRGSEYPRSYYRCTSSTCPVKKKVERSYDGCITEIIYKGQHNHDLPQHGRRGNRDVSLVDNNNGSQGQNGNFRWSSRDSANSAQPTCMMLHGPSDSEESGENYHVDDENDDEPSAKRRLSDGPFTHRTRTEPKIVVQTRSEVDLLDDGYRWRKYGQKVVKGNPNPRSYYKCTTEGCKVRKHVERASTDSKAVITTYEGKHIHDVPAPRGSSVNAANYEAQQLKLHDSVSHLDFDHKDRIPAALRLKQEQNLG